MESHNQQDEEARERIYEEAFNTLQIVTCKNCYSLVPSTVNGIIEECKFSQIAADINNEDQERQIKGLQTMRGLICIYNDNDSNFNFLLTKYGIVPICIRFLMKKELPDEALSTLNNIISIYSEQIQCALAYNAIPHIIYFLQMSSETLVYSAVLALFNISHEGSKACEELVQHATLDWVIKLLTGGLSIKVKRLVIALILNICRESMNLKFDEYKTLLSVLTKMLGNSDSYVLHSSICWSITCLTICNTMSVEVVLNFGGLTYLCDLLDNQDAQSEVPALRCLYHIASGTHQQLDAVMNSMFLTKLAKLLHHSEERVIKVAVWITSKIMKHKKYIEKFFQSGIVSQLGSLMQNEELQDDIALIAFYITAYGTKEQISLMNKEYGMVYKQIESISKANNTLNPVITPQSQLIFKAKNDEEAVEPEMKDKDTDKLSIKKKDSDKLSMTDEDTDKFSMKDKEADGNRN